MSLLPWLLCSCGSSLYWHNCFNAGPARQQAGSVLAGALATVAWLAELGCYFCYTALGSELMQQEEPHQQLCQMLMQLTYCQQH